VAFFGLTGGLGCGKSAAARCFSDLGWSVLDADGITHALYGDAGGEVVSAIRSHFGDAVLSVDGTVDRVVLGERVLLEPEGLRWLEGLLRPFILSELELLVEGVVEVGVVVDLPLLFEWGLGGRFPFVAAVYAEDVVRWRRLAEKGIDMERASALSALQVSSEEKVELSDFVLVNNGSMDFLRAQCGIVSRIARGEAV